MSLLVREEETKQRILMAIADEYSRNILMRTRDAPVSALVLSKNYGIPITTVYRRIEELVQAGLLGAVKSSRTSDGKWYELYRSLLSRINVSFDEGNIRVEVEINDHIADKFTRIWSSLATTNQILVTS
ncbi:MAG: helix-turn-helix domain-containing protein [Candidatus Bathyarchaeia archaeon]